MARPSKRNRAVAAAMLTFVVVSIGWFVVDIGGKRQTTPRRTGSFVFRGVSGPRVFRLNPHGRTLVMLYHGECAYCRTELDELDRGLDRLAGLDLYMLTTEDSLDIDGVRRKWPGLAASDRVTWGSMDRDTRAGHFGVSVTPALFLYDADGMLIQRWTGVTSIDVILSRQPRDSGAGCATVAAPASEPCTMSSPVPVVRRPADTSE